MLFIKPNKFLRSVRNWLALDSLPSKGFSSSIWILYATTQPGLQVQCKIYGWIIEKGNFVLKIPKMAHLICPKSALLNLSSISSLKASSVCLFAWFISSKRPMLPKQSHSFSLTTIFPNKVFEIWKMGPLTFDVTSFLVIKDYKQFNVSTSCTSIAEFAVAM